MEGKGVAWMARAQFARYLLASLIALSSDFAIFLLVDRAGGAPMAAATAGYATGLIVHWGISTRFVFVTDVPPTTGQRMAFVASALAGLAITSLLVGALAALGVAAALAKLLSVPPSFLSVYAIRKYGVFARA